MPRLELLRPQRLVSLPRQLVVDCGLGVVYQLELDTLDWLYGLNINDANATIRSCGCAVARYLQEELTRF